LDAVVKWTEEFFRFKKLAAHSKKMQESLRDDLLGYIEETAEDPPDDLETWTDSNGSQYVRLPVPVEDSVKNKDIQVLKREHRVSKILDEDRATELLAERKLLERCTIMVPVLDEESILALNFEGVLSDEDLKSLYDEKETWAFTQQEG